MKKSFYVNMTTEQVNALDDIAKKLGCIRGSQPNKSGLIRAIADRTLEVSRPEREQLNTLGEIGLFSSFINIDAVTAARRYAGLAHALLEAECYEEAEPHIKLGLTYALIAALEAAPEPVEARK